MDYDIDKINDERLLKEIQRLIHQEEEDIPEWHKSILAEREEKYGSSDESLEDWEDVKLTL